MDYFRHKQKIDAQRAAEVAGDVADSMDVRLALIARVKAGEITMAEAQAQLSKIRRGAKAAGKVTRANAYQRG